jgi:hypothetical protein
VRDEDSAVGSGCGCDQDVVRSDRRSRTFEFRANETVLLGATVIERKTRNRTEELLQYAQVISDPAALPRAVDKLSFDDGGQANLSARNKS